MSYAHDALISSITVGTVVPMHGTSLAHDHLKIQYRHTGLTSGINVVKDFCSKQ